MTTNQTMRALIQRSETQIPALADLRPAMPWVGTFTPFGVATASDVSRIAADALRLGVGYGAAPPVGYSVLGLRQVPDEQAGKWLEPAAYRESDVVFGDNCTLCFVIQARRLSDDHNVAPVAVFAARSQAEAQAAVRAGVSGGKCVPGCNDVWRTIQELGHGNMEVSALTRNAREATLGYASDSDMSAVLLGLARNTIEQAYSVGEIMGPAYVADRIEHVAKCIRDARDARRRAFETLADLQARAARRLLSQRPSWASWSIEHNGLLQSGDSSVTLTPRAA